MAEPAFEWRRRARRRTVLEPPHVGLPVLSDASVPVAPGSGPAALVLNGRYELGEALGAGGEATVHVARDLALGRDVAVKVFRARTVPPSRSSLDAIEARIAATMNHYALTTLLDAGVDRGPELAPQLYLVMEYVRGESLRQRVQRGAMEVSEVGWLGFDVAEGLDAMHQAGFLHRDVKPSNILIARVRSARPVIAKLTDFGITSRIEQPEIGAYTVGTAAYLSPEQVEGRAATPASDIYSLGLVLLEAVTGHVEFTGSVEQSAFGRLERDPVVPDTVPAPVAAILRGMTARSPRDRMPLHDVAVALQQFLVDDLLQRRETAGGPATAAPVELRMSDLVAPERMTPALDLVVLSLRATRATLSFEDDALLSEHGGSRRPVEVRAVADERTRPRWTAGDVATRPIPSDAGASEHPIARTAVTGGDGRVLALLTVFDRTPRTLDEHETAMLLGIVGLLRHDLELRLAMRRALFRAD